MIQEAMKARKLALWPVDGQGNTVTWGDPHVVNVVVAPADEGYHYSLEAFIKSCGLEMDVEAIENMRAEIIANGKRHFMKGNL